MPTNISFPLRILKNFVPVLQKIENCDRVKINLFLGNPKLENAHRALAPKSPVS